MFGFNWGLSVWVLRYWQTRTHCFGHIVAHDVSWAAQTGKHLLRTQSVSGLIIYMKKLLDSDWLRTVQFFLNTVQKRGN